MKACFMFSSSFSLVSCSFTSRASVSLSCCLQAYGRGGRDAIEGKAKAEEEGTSASLRCMRSRTGVRGVRGMGGLPELPYEAVVLPGDVRLTLFQIQQVFACIGYGIGCISVHDEYIVRDHRPGAGTGSPSMNAPPLCLHIPTPSQPPLC